MVGICVRACACCDLGECRLENLGLRGGVVVHGDWEWVEGRWGTWWIIMVEGDNDKSAVRDALILAITRSSRVPPVVRAGKE